ncbi:hypothetical protein OKS68_17915 [Aeromonas veronii]|uniref:hypothetical protein n=1 Tax=Aeromonas veronii TaxID=654 RepID=UPI00226C6B33|nr:hypothetical protein [Aeromonas veronii]MCX9134349.1 hypothetical protein [Aeromonas veronii]
MELTLLKMSGGVLVPSTPADAEAIRSLPIALAHLFKPKEAGAVILLFIAASSHYSI